MSNNNAALTSLRKKLEKRYKDSIELFPDFTVIRQIPVIPSPSAMINAITGVGGLPRGRVTEIHGAYSSGKTTIATEVVAAAQKADPDAVALYVDFEHAWDAAYARKLGTDLSPDRLVFAQPSYFEQGADIILACIQEGLVDIIVVDSIAAMTPKAELEGVMDSDGGSQKGTQAALMATFLTKATKLLNTGRKPALVLINQTRAVINIGGRPQKNAPKEQAAGGNAVKFYTSIRLHLETMAGEGDEGRGTKGIDQTYTRNRVRVTCVKNKLAPPHMRGQITIDYGKGINNIASIADLAEARLGIMSGAGFFKYEGDAPETSFTCRGRDAFQGLLEGSPALRAEIERKVLAALRSEQAESLGLEEIQVQGSAKDISSEGVTLLDDKDEDIQGSGNLAFEEAD